jgi:dolichol kinase
VSHAFAASFLVYYLLPNEQWLNPVKYSVLIGVLVFVALLEYLRIKGVFDSGTFFGLRVYEKNRPGSYLYFGVAVVLLLLFFPQQIAVPCILCGSLGDPLIGEFRFRSGKRKAIVLGFIVCLLFFVVTWYTADFLILIGVSFLGAACAVLGEVRKFRLLDDDFMIQMVPAVVLSVIWLGMNAFGVQILPQVIFHVF